MVLAVPAGTGAVAALDQTGAQSSFDGDADQPTKEEVDAYDSATGGSGDDASQSRTLDVHDGDGEENEEDESANGDSENYNENNVAVVNLENEVVIDVANGHVGDGSDHQTADDEDGSDAENSNQNNVAVVQTQDNAIVKGGDDGGDGGDDGGDAPV